MSKKGLLLVSALVVSAILAAGARPARAVEFPTKEIRMVIPFGAGGQSDLTARKLAEIIQKNNFLPQPILVVNMPGANTMNGLNAVLGAKPDGYTLLLHHTDMVTQKLYGVIPTHWSDFDMICQVMEINFCISAKADAPWGNGKDFAEEAKKNPGKYNISAPAPGGVTYLAGILFLQGAGLTNNEVVIRPSEGGASAATDIMSGAAAIRPAVYSDVARFVKGGQEKVLFTYDTKANPVFPGASLAREFGLENTLIRHSSGIFTTKGTPEDVKEKVAQAIKSAIETKEFQDFMEFQVCTSKYRSAKDWTEEYKSLETIFSGIIANMKK